MRGVSPSAVSVAWVRALDRELNPVRRDGGDRQIVGHGEGRAFDVVGVEDVVQIEGVELAVLEFEFQLERSGGIGWNREFEMNHLGGSGRDLVIVERGENILRIPAIDPVAVPIEHVNVHEMGPWID